MDIITIRHRINGATSLEELDELSAEIATAATTGRLDDLSQNQIGPLKLEISAKVQPLRAAAHQRLAELTGRIDRNTTTAVAEVRRQKDAAQSQSACSDR